MSNVRCPCGAPVSTKTPEFVFLDWTSVEAVASKMQEAARSSDTETAFFLAVELEFGRSLRCDACSRRLLLRRDGSVEIAVAEAGLSEGTRPPGGRT